MPKRPRWSEVQDDEMEEVEVEEERISEEEPGIEVAEDAELDEGEPIQRDDSEGSSDSFLGWRRSEGPGSVGAVVCTAGRSYVVRNEDDHKYFVMYDTGSDEHVCTMDFGGGGNLVTSQVRLNAVSGDALDIRGERKVALTLVGKGRDMVLDVVFQVSKNATKNILSAGKLYRAGFVVTIGKDGASTLWHPRLDVHIPLFLYGNSFYLRLKDSESKYRHSRTPDAMVAPVSDANSPEGWEHVGEDEVEDEPNLQDLPELRGGVVEDEGVGQLTPVSRVVDLRARLKELGWSTHGSKAVLFSRLKAAEKEEKKMRERRRKAEEEATARNEDLSPEVKMLPEPGKPTAAEVAKHNLTHIPSADWCEHCQKGKGKDKGHTKAEGAVDRAVIQMDYSYLKADGTETVEDAAEVILTAVDTSSGMTTAISLPAKNWEMGYVVRTLKSFIGQLGHVNVALRTDGEPTVVQMAEQLRDELNKTRLKDAVVRAYTERTPRYSPQSLGHVGARQALIKGDTLTMKSKLEEDYKKSFTPKDTIWPWMVRHAAWVRSRFGLKANRRTAYEDAFGTSYMSAIVPFGEVVLFKMPASASGRKTQGGRQLKGDFSWEKGVFLGKTNESDEFLLGTRRGVHTARTVKRLREELRISEELVAEMKGVPWNTGTAIGRPRRPLAEALPSPQTPKPAATGEAPGDKPMKMVKGRVAVGERTAAERKAEGEAEEQRSPKKTKVTDSSATLADDVEVRNYVEFPGSSTERAAGSEDAMMVDPHMEARVPTEDEMRTTEAWRKREAQLVERVEEVPKRMRIGEQVVGALYTPVLEPEDPDVDEEAVEEVLEVQPLSEEERLAGRTAELAKMDTFKTYTPVEKEEAMGKLVLDSTWVETRKPTGEAKCRYCLREFKSNSFRDDVYAVATTSATSKMIDYVGVMKGYKFFTADATNAFWQVPIDEECYMYPPEEWKEQRKQEGLPWDMMWKLNTEWYGRRVAGQKFVEWFAKILEEQGCKRSTVAPWFFYHPSWDISLEMHMDDLYGCGPEGNVKKFLESIHQQVKMKSEIHGPGDEFTHLKRVRSLDNEGNMHIRPDPKHIQAAVEILGIVGCRPASTPAVAGGTQSKKWEKEVPLDEEDSKIYRSVTGILMYLSPDRPDAQFAIRELTKSLKEPLGEDMTKLIRVVRYLSGTPDYGVKFSPGNSEVLNVYSDTDWANCKKSRTSTACATFVANNCLLGSYSRGLSMICFSSAEAEFNGGVGACSEALFYQQILEFHGLPAKLKIWLDSSAARGIFQRQGVGRVRHLEAKTLWVQTALREKRFELHAIGTNENPADIGTKALAEAKLVKHRNDLGMMSYMHFKVDSGGGNPTGENPTVSVGAIEKMERGVKLLMMLGMCQIPGVNGQGEVQLYRGGPAVSDLGWWKWLIVLSLVWTFLSTTVMTVYVVWMWRKNSTPGHLDKDVKPGKTGEKKTEPEISGEAEVETGKGFNKIGSHQRFETTALRRGEATSSGDGETKKEVNSLEDLNQVMEQKLLTGRYTWREFQHRLRMEGFVMVRMTDYVYAYEVDMNEPKECWLAKFGHVVHFDKDCPKMKPAKLEGITGWKVCRECHYRHLQSMTRSTVQPIYPKGLS